jgi:thioredoxin 1
MTIQQLSSAEEINSCLEANDLVLIDFWAPWCNPCKALEPTLREAAQEVNNVKVVKVNVDTVMGVSETYQVRGVPTLVLVKNNEVIGRKVGSINKSQLISFINTNI